MQDFGTLFRPAIPGTAHNGVLRVFFAIKTPQHLHEQLGKHATKAIFTALKFAAIESLCIVKGIKLDVWIQQQHIFSKNRWPRTAHRLVLATLIK